MTENPEENSSIKTSRRRTRATHVPRHKEKARSPKQALLYTLMPFFFLTAMIGFITWFLYYQLKTQSPDAQNIALEIAVGKKLAELQRDAWRNDDAVFRELQELLKDQAGENGQAQAALFWKIAKEKNPEALCRIHLILINRAIKAYKEKYGRYPDQLENILGIDNFPYPENNSFHINWLFRQQNVLHCPALERHADCDYQYNKPGTGTKGILVSDKPGNHRDGSIRALLTSGELAKLTAQKKQQPPAE